jgi:hypothetical protein
VPGTTFSARTRSPAQLNFPSTWPRPRCHPHSRAGASRIAASPPSRIWRWRGCPWASGRQRLETGVEAHAFHAVPRYVAEQRALQPPKLWRNCDGHARQTQAGEPPSRHIIACGGAGSLLNCGCSKYPAIRTLENQVKTAPFVSNSFVKGGLLLSVKNITYWVICDFVLTSAPPTPKPAQHTGATYRKA